MKNVVLQNSFLRVMIMPLLGGKVASIQLADGAELLQQPLLPYAARTPYMRFEDSDASGWDECLPSVAACEVETPSGMASIPDHGDFWQTAWQVEAQTDISVMLSANGFSLPLRFTKALRLEENCLRASYRVQNTGAFPVDYVWSAHPLFAIDPGDRILLPFSVKEVIVEGSSGERLGKHGSRQAWPMAQLSTGQSRDLSIAVHATAETGDKLFTPAPEEGWCAIERRALRRRIELHFDARILSWTGLWLCYGGWPEGKPNRQNCVALEPCMALGDSLAIASQEGRARTLAPGGTDDWSLDLLVKEFR